MSPRGRLGRTTPLASLAVAAAVVWGAAEGPARADDALALAQIARELGYHYTYLPYENAVELSRPGAAIVVRPGDPFFALNERMEPVFGMVPEYRRNDVYVSRAFVSEIRGLGHPFAPEGPSESEASARRMRLAPVDAGRVNDIAVAQVAQTSLISVTGHATPGARVTVVLKALISQNVPVVTLDSTNAFADSSGSFATVVSSAPDHFSLSQFEVQAAGAGDATPLTKRLPFPEYNPDARTKADDKITTDN